MSQIPQKTGQKMCKSPKNYNSQPTIKHEKIDYENLSTNCTVVGSNNLNLVKKPQIMTNMSPAYSNPSPGYPPSPYSSPASLKSPSPSLKPPTPQPNFPVMQIIHNNQLLARPIQTSQPQNIIKLKPHLNILPKPAASPQPSPKPSVSPQIMIPTNQQAATIMPTAQPLLLNQMPMLTAPGVQFILRPQTATKIPTQMQTATATPQGLILQPGGQPLLQIQPPRSQPMVRVLTNGMHLAPSTTTYVTQMANQQPISATHIAQHQAIVNNVHQQQQQVAAAVLKPKKPKNKVKKKLDLATIMKQSGIGDEDDIQFESDTSQSESEHNSVPTTPQPQNIVQTSNTVQAHSNLVQHTDTKKIGNIQISALPQQTINAATPVVQVLNQNFQSGMISNSTSQTATPAGIPFNSFITPNFTINNGLMLHQRSGGFKLTMGEDGRLVLQHDPTLNQDLQSQLILQSLLGLNGGLVLQPSMDQQTVQQTVQTIQQQSVQTIQQQTVQSQTIQTVQQQTVQPQTVQHTLQSLQPQIQQQTVQQTIQHQTVQSQPLTALQQPMQIVQPTPIHSIHSQVQPSVHSIQSQVQLQSIQGQIQSLLQQQNHAVQTQTVQHSHVQPQSVQHQTIQNVQPQQIQIPSQSPVSHIQTHQQAHTQTHQPVLKVQPFQKSQPPVQTVHPQPIQSMQQQNLNDNNNQQGNQNHPPTSYVVNLTPDQLEQLKRNGQLTVNGQTIFMQRSNNNNKQDNINNDNIKKMSPKIKPVNKKINNKQPSQHTVKSFLHHDNNVINDNLKSEQLKETNKGGLINALQAPAKQILPQQQQNHVQLKSMQPSAVVQPQKMVPKPQASPKIIQQKVTPNVHQNDNTNNGSNQDVEKFLGQFLEDNSNMNIVTSNSNLPPQNMQQQRIHTIQLTPQKQQHLKSIQLQIQTLSARLTPGDTEMQNALKLLFDEQRKILESGKLLPPDKVYYHNNQLTIVNPSSLSPPPVQVKKEVSPVQLGSHQVQQQQQQQQQHQNTCGSGGGKNVGVGVSNMAGSVVATANVVRSSVVETSTATNQAITTQTHSLPRISVSVPSSEHVVAPPPQTPPQIVHTHHQQQATHQSQQAQQQQQQQHSAQQQQHHQLHANNHIVNQRINNHHHHSPPGQPTVIQQQQQQQQQQFHSIAKKAHLVETQLNLDQNGAIQPDIHTPFKDKKDACIRLIRYHCLDQPVLSQKDLDKADEIFELTARHFIGKYAKMIDKYKYLLMKESMRQVQTSELMMLDRMFLAEEQQSLMKLRQDFEEAQFLDLPLPVPEPAPPPNPPPPQPDPTPEDYDEWACIQRELGCLPPPDDAAHHPQMGAIKNQTPPCQNVVQSSPIQPPKRTASSDSRLETLKRFRVEKHHISSSKSNSVNISGNNTNSVSSSNCYNNNITQQRHNNSSSLQIQTQSNNAANAMSSSSSSCSYEGIQQQNNSSYSSQDDNEPENNSIDEQVQSAIDSILNLQQNTALDLDSILS